MACRAVGFAEAGPIRDASLWVVSAESRLGPSRDQGPAQRSIEHEDDDEDEAQRRARTANCKPQTANC